MMYCVISGCGFPVKVYHNAMEAMTNDPWKKMIYHDWFKIVIFPPKKTDNLPEAITPYYYYCCNYYYHYYYYSNYVCFWFFQYY